MARFSIAALALALSLGAQDPVQKKEPPSEDPGRPVLRRGGPAQRHETVKPAESKSTGAPQADPDAISASGGARPAQPAVREVEVDADGKVIRASRRPDTPEDLIERAREAAFEFNEKLPDFVCEQYVLRYESKTFKPEWKLKDRVQVETIYAGGKEEYRNARINGKLLKKGSPEDSGSWSMYEFGTVLLDVLSTSTNAAFKVRGDSSAVGLPAKVFDFSVLQPNSHWRIRYGREVKPAYKGAVWIDPTNARVLRIEMNSRQLPLDYDIDTVELTVDYGWVTISGRRYLLPVKSENLSCYRGTFRCTKNETEFRNYRKFSVESQVLQVESEIKFPTADDEKAAKPKGKTEPPSITPKPEDSKKDPAKNK